MVDSKGREMSLNVNTLSVQKLPCQYQEYLQFFEVLDKAYCFLTKNRLKCSVATICQLCCQLLSVTDLSRKAGWDHIQRGQLETLSLFCPQEIKLVDLARKEGLGPNDAQIDFTFVSFPGIGATHSKARRQVLLTAMWTAVAQDFIQKCGEEESVEDVLKRIKKINWPATYNVDECLLPQNTPIVTPSSSSSSSSNKAPTKVSTTEEFAESNPVDLEVQESHKVADNGPFSDIIDHLQHSEFYTNQIKHIIRFPAKSVCFEDLDTPLPEYIQQRLKDHLHIDQLYRHQTRAINAIRCGKHVVVSTSTSSGKSLIYNLPVFESMLQDPTVTAMYLFPTKALSQDQLRSMVEFAGNTQTSIVPVVCDGDTSRADRLSIQQGVGNLFLTNPDMIHHSLLPEHKAWKRLFANLKFVIIDEAHHYSGAFGSHVACVIRRLVRMCLYYGSCPQFVCCSATIANPAEHIGRLIPLHLLQGKERYSSELVVVGNEDDGAPHGERTFLIWNPYDELAAEVPGIPRYQRVAVSREDETTSTEEIFGSGASSSSWKSTQNVSPIVETATLFATLVMWKLRTIAFCKTRKLVELVYKYALRNLERWNRQDLFSAVSSYRGGYMEAERRAIESDLFHNRLLGVAATCALELGIDVGSLDVSVHMGFPGSFSSLWQQAGRAGRSGRPSLSIILCFECALDQYFSRNPDVLLRSEYESAILDVDNIHVLRSHIACAAKEVPLNFQFTLPRKEAADEVCVIKDDAIWGEKYREVVDLLFHGYKLQLIKPTRDSATNNNSSHKLQPTVSLLKYWSDGSYTNNEAAKEISLRMIDPISISVLDDARNDIIDTVEYSRAFFELFEGAIFMHRGKQYNVSKLDLASNVAHSKVVNVPYYTSARNETAINIVKPMHSEGLFSYGIVQVVSKVNGYYKRRLGSGEIVEEGVCSLPPLEYETTAMWIDFPMSIRSHLEQQSISAVEAMHAANHILVGISPLIGQCDPSDIGTEHGMSKDGKSHTFRMLLYDKRPGGLGSCAALYASRLEVLKAAFSIVDKCPCYAACPSCVLDARCTTYNKNLSKNGARQLLSFLISGELPQVNQSKQITEPHRADMICSPAMSSSVPRSPAKKKPPTSLEITPSKKQRQNSLQKASIRDSARSRTLTLQSSWTAAIPDFITESDK